MEWFDYFPPLETIIMIDYGGGSERELQSEAILSSVATRTG